MTFDCSVSLRPQLPKSGFIIVSGKRIAYHRNPRDKHGLFTFPFTKDKGARRGRKLKLDKFIRKDVQG